MYRIFIETCGLLDPIFRKHQDIEWPSLPTTVNQPLEIPIETQSRSLMVNIPSSNMENSTIDIVIVRLGGRLANADLSFDAKFQGILLRQHRFTKLYAEFLHRTDLCAGARVLLSLLRQTIWVPFLTPYKIRSKSPYKTYASISIASKAIHIALIPELTTNAFLSCIQRFIVRRGLPQRIYCDKATNFVEAANKMNEFKTAPLEPKSVSLLKSFSACKGFAFSFIPPRAPHFGGLWEAAVSAPFESLHNSADDDSKLLYLTPRQGTTFIKQQF